MAEGNLRRLLSEIDAALAERVTDGRRLDLYLVGRSALILRYGATHATRDLDVLDQTNDNDLLAELL